MKNILKVLLACLLVTLMLMGCTPDNSDLPDDSADTTTPAVSDTDPVPVLTLFDASTSYTVIRTDECGKQLKNIAANFRSALNDMTTFKVSIKTDWIRPEQTPDPDTLEILLAKTNHPESLQVLESLGFHDYAIKVVGKKLVIAAHNADTLQAALDYTLQNLIKVADDGTVTLTAEYTYQSGISDMVKSAEQLAEYKLVVAAQNDSAARLASELEQSIKDACGVELQIVDDSTAASEKEIVIGKTARSEYDVLNDLAGMEYTIAVNGSKVVLGGNTTTATSLAVDAFTDAFLPNDFSDVCKIPSEYNKVTVGTILLEGGEDPALTEGADLRVMSFNILAELWDEKAAATMPGRDEHVANIILSYQPDVVGLQETTDLWYSLLEPRLEGLYKFASYQIPSGYTNYSTLIYNTSTTELIECKTVEFPAGNIMLRNLTWGRFRRISDGAEYIVTCTHWSTVDEEIDIQWPINAQLINDLYAQYGLPIFSTGDYNSTETEQFGKFLEATQMLDPKYTAKVINNAGRTTHKLSETRNSTEPCIDHIACTPNSELLYYNVLICKTALDASDHCPIYIDVKLK